MATPEEVGGSGESQQVPNGSLSSQTVRERLRRSESEENAEETFAAGLGSGNKKLRLAVRTVIGVLLFLVVLGCVVFSKLSLVALADRLRHVTVNRTKKQVLQTIYPPLASFKSRKGGPAVTVKKSLTRPNIAPQMRKIICRY